MNEPEVTINRAAMVAAMERQTQVMEQQAKYAASPITRALAMVQAPLTGGSGWYAGLPRIIDVSHWQSDAAGKSSVDWDLLAVKPGFVGAYVKAGEVGDTGDPHTTGADYWMDLTLDDNLTGLYRNRCWAGAYFFFNPAWALQRGWGMNGITNLNTGATDEERANNLLQEPHIYLIARRLKQSLGRQFRAPAMKAAKDKVYDAIIIDLERYWMRYPISTANGVVNDEWIAATVGAVLKGLDWLMTKGYLPRKPVMVYSAEWYLRAYGNRATRAVLDFQDTICAGYYWPSVRKATTWDGITADLATIPNNWKPPLFGGATEGKAVRMLQISGDHFVIPEVKSGGRPSGLDINVWNGDLASMLAFFPEWAARRGEPVPPPPPPPPPPKTRTIATVLTQDLRMRTEPTTIGYNTLGNLDKGTRLVVTETRTVDGNTWRRVTLEAPEIWVAERYAGTRHLAITEEPEP